MDHLSPEEQKKLLDQIKRHEGTKRDAAGFHIAYRCTAGALTIGYGHNLDATPVPGINAQSRLNDDQVERLLMADLVRFSAALETAFPWVLDLSAARYAVLLNMAFNLGVAKLKQFKPTLELIRLGDYKTAAGRMMRSKWATDVGDGPGGKFDRAEQLAKQMETGAWQ